MTRFEFGLAVRALLTEEQRAEIARLHSLVEDGWCDGCAAHNESASCCVDEITDTAADGMQREEM